ncbi:hypothetical protein HanOQP8_Chr05g0196801 [Helianthus annuus]|nr:hypothetical protein HanIR_Chr05g0248241 [Helianthus annuus]KAJ0748066.1 hypothetical protein HanOQP8_Chr05g0196801 [Helianthus annuus]
MAHILHYYGFHISQMSPPGMVRVRHFEFLCRSHGIEPTVEKFRAFYQLIRNMGFYSFCNRGSAKKILLNPPMSFHVWKQKFFFIREEVIPIAMIFRESDTIEKEELAIPKMSDKWPEDSNEVPVLKFQDREAHLYQAAFPTFGGSMDVHPLESGDPYMYERIKGHFLYPPAGAFANPPTTTEGAHLPNPRPQQGKRFFIFPARSVLRDLGIDPEEKKKKTSKKKKKVITIDAEPTSKKGRSSRATTGAFEKGTLRFRQSNLEDYIVASDSFEGLSRIGEKKTSAAVSKSSGSVGSRNPDTGATPSSIALDEEEEEEEQEEEPTLKLVSRKRSREETAAGIKAAQKAGGAPVIGKQSKLRSLYKFSPG